MRATKLLGALFLIAGFFTLTRGNGWQVGYILGGLALAFVGLLLTTRVSVRRLPAPHVGRTEGASPLPQKVRVRA